MEINSILSSIQNTYVTSSKKKETSVVEEKILSETEKLEAFKKEIWNEINSMSWNSCMNISIQITDSAFERMMNDSEFKDKMMNVLREESVAAQPPGDTSLTWIDENGYKGYSYIDTKAGYIAFESHSSSKDKFYVKKAKRDDISELWKQKQLERKQILELREQEYFDSLVEKRRYSQKQLVANLYENGTFVSESGI